MKLIRLLIMLVCLTLAQASVSHGASKGEIAIKADGMSQDQANDTFNAIGNVEITYEGMVLNADRASYNRKTGMMTATGNVYMKKGDDTLRGASFTLDVATGRAELNQGSLSVYKGNITFTGEKIVREDDIHLMLFNSELTTCDLPRPDWKFGAGELKANLLGYTIGRSVVFYIKDVPVLYIPWIAFPTVPTRRTGILFPRFGNSNTRGAEVDIPLYWAISSTQDLLLDLDFQTKRGIGTGLEYRYIRKRGSEGKIGGYLIYDHQDERWRGQIYQNHKEIYSPDLNLRMDINLDSDRNFSRDYGEKSGDYNRQSIDTVVNILKTWQNFALTADLRYSELLYTVDNSQTVQVVPEIGLAAVRQKIFNTPLYFDLDSSVANIYREAGPKGQRLHVFPRLTVEEGFKNYLQYSVFAGAHLRAYNTENIPVGSGVHENDTDLLPTIGARFSTSLNRVYDFPVDQLKKLRHEVVPEITYRYTPERDQARLPFYDFSDRLIWQNIGYYSLTNHLGGKFQNGDTTEYIDIMRVKFMQGYSFEGTRRDELTLVDANHHWTDFIMETDTWVYPNARITLDTRYNVYDRQISSIAPGVDFDDKLGTSVGGAYRMSRNQLEYLEGHLITKYFKPWTFSYSTRYSFDRPGGYLDGFLESVYSAEYRQKCWSVTVSLTDRPGNTSFHVNFNLLGLTGS